MEILNNTRTNSKNTKKFLEELGIKKPTQEHINALMNAIKADNKENEATFSAFNANLSQPSELNILTNEMHEALDEGLFIKDKVMSLIGNDSITLNVGYDFYFMNPEDLDTVLDDEEQDQMDDLIQDFSDCVNEYLDIWFMRFLQGRINNIEETVEEYATSMFGKRKE